MFTHIPACYPHFDAYYLHVLCFDAFFMNINAYYCILMHIDSKYIAY
jgi:hypothetical protein